MTTRLPSSNLGQDKLADVWRKVEKRHLKRLTIDLKQRLNRCAAAIKQGVIGA
jgi:primosomal protein N''